MTDHSDPEHDALDEHPIADLSGDSCRVEAGNICIGAIIVGLTEGAAAVDSKLAEVAQACPDELPFSSPGPGFEDMDITAAVAERLRETVEYLTQSP